MGVTTCACGCGEPLPEDAHHNQKYVNVTHRRRMEKRRERRRKRESEKALRSDAKPVDDQSLTYGSAAESKDGRGTARRGPGYRKFLATEWPDKLRKGEADRKDAEKALDESGANISRWMAAYLQDLRAAAAAEDHEPAEDHLEDLGAFTRRYFPHMQVKDFHKEWAEAIDETVGTGKRLLLLAPVRHGKTEMLVRYCLMRIAQNPNITIGWVSQTQTMAERIVRYMRLELETNEKLINDVLPPGHTFEPPTRSAMPWTNRELVVSNRTQTRKSSTLTAFSTGGTIVGEDLDLIVLDDPQDRDRCGSPTRREDDLEWLLTDFMSRKMAHSGLAFIMSRQHPDDLPGNIIRDHADGWDIRVYQAHDPACTIPEDDPEAHRDCMLWHDAPHLGFEWLMERKTENEANYYRNYLNDPRTDKTTWITAADLEAITDTQRRVGEASPRWRLIAGIDPAEAKPVAAVLWGWDPETDERHVIDCVEASASVVGLREILSHWPDVYGVRHFQFEKNIAQSWLFDAEVKALKESKNLVLHEHYTSRINKNSSAIGPVAMFQRMRGEDTSITLPGAGEGLDRIDRLKRSWLSFDPDYAHHKHADDDLTMAAWFPQLRMDTWWDRAGGGVVVHASFGRTSYPSSPFSTAPWKVS